MGGGGPIPHDDVLTDDEFNGDGDEDITDTKTIYGKYFTNERKNIFHYCVFCHDGEREQDGTHWGDSFIVCDNKMDPKINDQAQTFMHELGHGLGLHKGDYKGIDTDKVSYNDYPSVMNYNWEDGKPIDYSNGKGYDDWGNLDEFGP
jgi:hypothetical protein